MIFGVKNGMIFGVKNGAIFGVENGVILKVKGRPPAIPLLERVCEVC